jgi:hypothetical protein
MGIRNGRRESMNRKTDYAWYRAVLDALAEHDPIQIETRLQLAEVGIFERIGMFSREDHGEEEEALFEALVILRVLKIRHVAQQFK